MPGGDTERASEEYDAIVIGAGQSGGPLSSALAEAGMKTAVIESKLVGGTCINYGCTPTKTMVASARVAYMARRAGDYGVHTGRVTVNMEEVRRRKRRMVVDFRGGSEHRLENKKGLDLIYGEASFTGPKQIEVALRRGGTRRMHADRFFINTGASPSVPPLEGLSSVPFLDSTSVMELDTVPRHLIVLGGGYIGLEFAQMFGRFGSRVTVIQRSAHLLAREDNDVADAVADILREDGVEVLLNTETISVRRAGERSVRLTIRARGERARSILGSHLLVAVGRTPNTGKLNLIAAGVETDERGFIKVNGKLETNVEGVYAMGDVNGGPAFTHISYDDYRILRTNVIQGGNARTTGRMVPYTVFTDPQLGRVGLTETQARAEGYKVRVAKMPMNYVARAIEVSEDSGFMKAVVDGATDRILGCAILGMEGGEIMAMLEIAMMGKLPYTTLKEAIFAHPTLAESLNNLFGSFQDS
ncbi:MAG TPA: mercuric reductase [Chloroflexia bacterium]|nr:mercuric reductase [Chloroflexia bacterium]